MGKPRQITFTSSRTGISGLRVKVGGQLFVLERAFACCTELYWVQLWSPHPPFISREILNINNPPTRSARRAGMSPPFWNPDGLPCSLPVWANGGSGDSGLSWLPQQSGLQQLQE